ncbi:MULTISPECIES: GatB/YqeY domain-containing protein [Thermoactinomyces]|uniref:GatB/YqeY domain-containing protein n=1 Tax=Thermoactinomyces daqus TaxID=1329516 RepID=A0A7W2AIE0_9BACL|nr:MULTISPECIES: GatB/YqeY domain-containing protein [Thermoactinomyces]MBA4542639.1 GatB/YqeY domain-containing protein [Thermoactinomyces daqus]MBH8597382.1 GatB/YqeY domain-containing protein [Thermoactinomyces sp. CICC 10523]MBH8602943.1 GatB/YqeY domain-containing protein [Thermoactinomyces sp. CICC 10522]MBH8607209.1 GatB/YqeY domain-containing protein [Thermoactinomyces sp. CICC 10521]
MSLLEQLNEDMKLALKNKEKTKLSTIRMLKSSIKKAEIDKRRPLTDEEVLEVVLREVKQRQDSLSEYEKAGREDLVQKEKEEMEILRAYLPEQMSEDEVKALVQQVIQELGASSKADMGKVMGALMPKVKGRADGRLVNRLVSEALS